MLESASSSSSSASSSFSSSSSSSSNTSLFETNPWQRPAVFMLQNSSEFPLIFQVTFSEICDGNAYIYGTTPRGNSVLCRLQKSVTAPLPQPLEWIELSPRHYSMVIQPCSKAQLEVEAEEYGTIKRSRGGQLPSRAPLRVLSFDIETLSLGGYQPLPKSNPVIQISVACITITDYEQQTDQFVFTLGSCLPITQVQIVECQNEKELLERWRSLFLEFDPDVITGYWITGFDLPYIIKRAATLKIPAFSFICRRTDEQVLCIDCTSWIGGTVKRVGGRHLIDPCNIIKENFNLPSYKLGDTSKHFLGEDKMDVDYRKIPDLHMGDEETRRKLAHYCLRDSMLAFRLFKKLNCHNTL